MTYEIYYPESKVDNVMSLEQFEQVVEAILAGKYSWACVLLLRFSGYNPLHYIPYRTYNRLMKEHNQGNSGVKKTGHRLNSHNQNEPVHNVHNNFNKPSIKSQLHQTYRPL